MLKKELLLGLILLGASMSAGAVEIHISFKQGIPTAAEFVLAAKRTFYKRNYAIDSFSDSMVVGTYKGRMEMKILLRNTVVIIRNTDPAGYKDNKIKGYLKNLKRDMVYELAEFIL
jgi:hypothetical protein